jgi:DNA-binding NarL/FixJ family response regulator
MEPPVVSITHAKSTVSAGIATMLFACNGDIFANTNRRVATVLITDYAGGLAAAWERRARGSTVPGIIVVTDRVREWELRIALDSGVDCILTEHCDAGELAAALACTQCGRGYLSASIAERARASLRLKQLTHRERQVLQMVGKGLCNKSIARALGIAEVTAKRHLQHMMNKLGAQSRTQAVVIGCASGLIDLDEAGYVT